MALSVGLVLLPTACGQRGGEADAPVVVIGVDGGEWRIIESMWAEDRLPNLRRMAAEGITARMRTIDSASPVIWTSIATGVVPARHGITDFTVATAHGDQPVSSTQRRVPALWNMASAVRRRVAVVNWWGTWPAEEVDGVVVSDRALTNLDDRVTPARLLPRLEELQREALSLPDTFGGNDAAKKQDQVTALVSTVLAGEGFDLLLTYFRGVDIACHFNWKYFEPEAFPGVDRNQVPTGRERIFRVYDAVDRAIGDIRRAAGPDATTFVMSDHGFKAMKQEKLRIMLKLDPVLSRLGFLRRNATGVDFGASLLYTYASPDHVLAKKVRYCLEGREAGGKVTSTQRATIRRRLVERLGRITYAHGKPALSVRDADPEERRQGADFVVQVLPDGAVPPLMVDGQPLPGALWQVTHLSGTHDRRTDGIFFAAGPRIDPSADVDAVDVLDMTPTILYAMGLPVAESFDGRPRTDLFTPRFQRRNPVRTIPSWGETRETFGTESAVDQALLDELRALGYIDEEPARGSHLDRPSPASD